MTRILITGGPRTGKTTLAEELFREVSDRADRAGIVAMLRHTDDLIAQCQHLGKDSWSEASRIASTWLDDPGPWIIEGVALCRALRKWREAHPNMPPPVDKIYRLTTPHVELTSGQRTMAKGEQTVWDEIEAWLFICGIPVVTQAEIVCTAPGHNGTATL